MTNSKRELTTEAPPVYLHILGTGQTPSAIRNSKGHLFESLMTAMLKSLKMEVTRKNKSESGLEIDMEGETVVGKVKFFAECKAHEDPLDSNDVQTFGFKFLMKWTDDPVIRGFLFTLSPLNSKAQELWDTLKNKYNDAIHCYLDQDIVRCLIDHYQLASPDLIRRMAQSHSGRACGDTQLLCAEDANQGPALYWAQLLMSSDGTEPNFVAFYGPTGVLIHEPVVVDRLRGSKPDLQSTKLTCLNFERPRATLPDLDDISPVRRVVRVRMSKSWFDYRFPAAPQFFVGRNTQRSDLAQFIDQVRLEQTSTRGFLFLGKSGIGKSSLALKARQDLERHNVAFLPIDCRLCDDVSFLFDSVNELLLELRQIPVLARPLDAIRVRGLDSLVDTLTEMHAVLTDYGYQAILFFDQFEKVFELPDVAKAIRTLFLRVTERQLSILFGFAWKSDLWSMAEGFPHHERDDIVREAYPLKQLAQFGQEETNEVLRQLEAQWGERLSVQLHKQLAIFSRGLPWLLKKVCAHVLDQHERGVTQAELIETNLKLQDLFEADLAGLDDEERALLRALAPHLPATLRRLSESFEISNIDRSLYRFIDKRILVKITEDATGSHGNVKYDVYSDIFREFLITGTVPIDDAYYFYMYPPGALKFFEKVRQRETLSIDEEIKETGRQMPSVYNLSRDLRSLGLVNVRNKVFSVADEVKRLEADRIIPFIQGQLKRNRVVSLTLSELNENGKISLPDLAALLQEMFPSVQAKDETWEYYSRTTAAWLHEARLAYYDNREKMLHRVDDEAVFDAVVERGSLVEAGFRLPMCFRNSVVAILAVMASIGESATIGRLMEALRMSHQSVEKMLSDGLNLKFIAHEGVGRYCLTPLGSEFARSSDEGRRLLFGQQCSELQAFNKFVACVREGGERGVLGKEAARHLVQEMKLELAEATVEKLGAILGNWAEYAGKIARVRGVCVMREYVPDQMRLL